MFIATTVQDVHRDNGTGCLSRQRCGAGRGRSWRQREIRAIVQSSQVLAAGSTMKLSKFTFTRPLFQVHVRSSRWSTQGDVLIHVRRINVHSCRFSGRDNPTLTCGDEVLRNPGTPSRDRVVRRRDVHGVGPPFSRRGGVRGRTDLCIYLCGEMLPLQWSNLK